MQLIVAEKPSVARDLARVLGVRPEGKHCFEGRDHVITWCIGHLVELEEPAAYDPRWRAWRLDTLPMLPTELRLRPAPHAVAQLRAVVRLLGERRFTAVVNACDAGREGELIFRYVYQYAGGGPPVRRLWISSLTDEAIRRGFAALRPGAQLDALADAARSRSEADWLVGMNATRAVTARSRDAGGDALYSIGRVQTPTLAMLVGREQAIRAFVPRPYWEVRGELRTAGGERFSALWRRGAVSRLGAAALAAAICERDAAAGGAVVERVRARTVREPPPLLFDLTSLQRTANRRFGFSAARTLEIAQALYERHKALTYPRTDSRHLTSDVVPELPSLFEALGGAPEYAAFAAELLQRAVRPGRRIVDDAKVSDHHAIIPTARPVRLEALDRDERRLFDLVARRFLGAFYPDAELAVTEVWVRVGAGDGALPREAAEGREGRGAGERGAGERGAVEEDSPILEALPPLPDRYFARGRVRLVAGWQEVAGIGADAAAAGSPDERRAGDAEPASALPQLAEGQPLAGAYAPVAKETKPPPRYTEATLLAGMESAGRTIDDEALRQAMRDTGLGTPATRAAVIETLLRRGYIERARQHLVPTETGIGLISALPVASLASAELTGQWEARLARIARGEDSRAAFMADIERYVRETVDAIREAAPPAPPAGGSGAAASFSGDGGDRSRWRGGTRAKTAGSGKRARSAKSSWSAGGKRGRSSKSSWSAEGKRGRSSKSSWSAGGERAEASRSSWSVGGEGAEASRSSWPGGGEATGGSASSRTGASKRAEASKTTRTGAGKRSRKSKSSRGARGSERVGTGARSRGAARRFGESSAHRGSGGREMPSLEDHPAFQDLPPIEEREEMWERAPRAEAVHLREMPPLEEPAAPRAAPARPAASTRATRQVPRPASFAIDLDGDALAAAALAAGGGAASATPSSSPSHAASSKEAPSSISAAIAPVAAPPTASVPAAAAAPASLACPRCRIGSLITGARGWGCSRWREGCRFVVWFQTAGRRLTDAQLRDLVTRGRTRKARFVADGAPIMGRLVLDPDAAGDIGAARFEPA